MTQSYEPLGNVVVQKSEMFVTLKLLETLSGVYKFELVQYIYIYIYVWRYMKQNSSACHVYVI